MDLYPSLHGSVFVEMIPMTDSKVYTLMMIKMHASMNDIISMLCWNKMIIKVRIDRFVIIILGISNVVVV